MLEIKEMLEEMGLTRSEIVVYLALLELGSSTTGPIIKKAGIASGKAYIILDKLILKGLVTYTIVSGRKNFQAKDPERLLDYLKDRENELKVKEQKLTKVLPYLKSLYERKKHEQVAEIFEGVKGFITFYNWLLKEMKKGDVIYVIGVPRNASEKFEGFFKKWNSERIRKGTVMRIVYTPDRKDIGDIRSKLALTEVRYLRKGEHTPAWIVILNDCVATITVSEMPVMFLIKNSDVAKSYKQYFDILWKNSVR